MESSLADDEERDDGDDALPLSLRSLMEGAESRGCFLEIIRLCDARVVGHTMLPPVGMLRIAGVEVRGVRPGLAYVDGRELLEGERCNVPLADGELWVRFMPAPARLLPAEMSRLAFVLFLVVACLASLSSGAVRGLDAARGADEPTPAGALLSGPLRRARRRRERQFSYASRRRVRRRSVRRVRRPRTARAQRPVRRALPRRSAPEPDGGDGPGGDDDEAGARVAPTPRARGPPGWAALPTIPLPTRRTACSFYRSS